MPRAWRLAAPAGPPDREARARTWPGSWHQGNVEGNAIYVATHALRAYTDSLIEFDVNRDNAITAGSGLICISGYVAG